MNRRQFAPVSPVMGCPPINVPFLAQLESFHVFLVRRSIEVRTKASTRCSLRSISSSSAPSVAPHSMGDQGSGGA